MQKSNALEASSTITLQAEHDNCDSEKLLFTVTGGRKGIQPWRTAFKSLHSAENHQEPYHNISAGWSSFLKNF